MIIFKNHIYRRDFFGLRNFFTLGIFCFRDFLALWGLFDNWIFGPKDCLAQIIFFCLRDFLVQGTFWSKGLFSTWIFGLRNFLVEIFFFCLRDFLFLRTFSPRDFFVLGTFLL